MRRKRTVSMRLPTFHLLCLCLALSTVLAQESKLPEPELRNVIYLLDPSDHTLKPLPNEPGKINGKLRPSLSYVTGYNLVQIPGTTSSFRLKGGNDLEFLIKCRNPDSLRLYVNLL